MLQKQELVVNFGQGIDTKTDPKQVVPGDLLALTNGTFESTKRIKKRNGYSAFSKNILGGGTIAAGVSAAAYQNELLSLDGSDLFSYSTSTSDLVNKGTLKNTSLQVTPIIRNMYEQTLQDSAINGNLMCFTWLDSRGGLYYSVIDSTSGQALVSSGIVDIDGLQSKVFALGSYFVIVYFEHSQHINYRAINIATPTSIGSIVFINNDMNDTNSNFDCTIINGSLFIAYNSMTANTVSVYSLSPTLVLSTQFNATSTSASADSVITIFGDASNNAWVVYRKTSQPFFYFIVNNALTSFVLPVTDTLLSPSNSFRITGIVTGTIATIYFETAPNFDIELIDTFTLDTVGTHPTGAVLKPYLSLASKVFSYNGDYYFLGQFQGSQGGQPTYFLMDELGQVVTKISPGTGGFTRAIGGSTLPEVNVVSSGVYQFSTLIVDELTSVNGTILTQSGIQSNQITFSTVSPQRFTLAQEIHFTGGLINMYDGRSIVEHGYNVYPETGFSSAPQVNQTGAIGPGTDTASENQVQYSAVYEWMDNQGQIHSSAPSIPVTVKLPAGGYAIGSGTFTNSSNTITATTTSNFGVGQYVTSFVGGSPDTVNNPITSLASTTVTMLHNYTGTTSTGPFVVSSGPTLPFPATCTTMLFSNTVTTANTTGILEGMTISEISSTNLHFPVGTYVTSVATNLSFQTSAPAIKSESGVYFFTLDVNAITIYVMPLTLTQKQSVSIALYRTTVNGTIFYRVTSVTSPIINDPTRQTDQPITDIISDNILIGNDELYTNGGELENIEAPACYAATTFKNRAIVLPVEQPNSWWYSKQVIPGTPVQFTDSFVENVDSSTGNLTAVGAMDDKLILFKNSSIYYVYGDGPAPSGANNDFSEAQIISTETGCNNPNSVVLMPDGLMFQSPKGIYLLDRSLQTHYVGDKVEAYNSYVVTSSKLLTTLNQVRFTLSNGQTLVYDYYTSRINQKATWSVFTNVAANDATIYDGNFTYIMASGQVLTETPGVFTDNGAFIQLSLTTSWLSLAGFQGYQRVWRFLIIGEYASPHILEVNVATDYATSFAQNVSIPVPSAPTTPYQFRIHMLNQKCETMQVQIQDTQTSPFGEGFNISGITLEVGSKVGADKLPAAQSYG